MTKEEAQKKADEMNEAALKLCCPMNLLRECVGINCAWFVKAYAKLQYWQNIKGSDKKKEVWRVLGDASCSITYLASIGENECPMI